MWVLFYLLFYIKKYFICYIITVADRTCCLQTEITNQIIIFTEEQMAFLT